MAAISYDWSHLASQAQSDSSESGGAGAGSHHGAPTTTALRAYADSFHGSYPSAPRLGPVDLPGSDSPMPYGFVSPGPRYNGSESNSSSSSSSRSRSTSLPAEGTGLGIYAWGYPSPPISPQNSHDGTGAGSGGDVSATAPNDVHPLLRTSAPIEYNILSPLSLGSHLRTTTGVRVSEAELDDPATYPTCSRLTVSIFLYPSGAYINTAPRLFIWNVQITPSRRSVDSASGNAFLRIRDALESLHLFVSEPVHESKLRRLPPQEVYSARTSYASRRTSYPTSSPSGLVRADFLYGCTQFAGIFRNADNSFFLKLVPPSASASASAST